VSTAQVLLRGSSGYSGCSGELGEPRVISAWVEAASLLTDFGTKQKKSCVQLPSSPFDIQLSLRQSLGVTELGSWKYSFPLSISPDLQFFTITSKVFRLQPNGKYRQVDTLSSFTHPRLRKSWLNDRYFAAHLTTTEFTGVGIIDISPSKTRRC
jgi:hypothetical protein